MSQPNDLGDAPSGPGLSAPEGASIPIALPPAVAFVDSLETGEKGWLNAMAWEWDEMRIPLYTADQLRAFAQAVAKRCAEICAEQQSLFVRNRFGESDYETGLHDAARDDAKRIRAEFGLKETPDA